MNGIRRRFARDESGQEIIEFAVTSLVFFMVIFGTLQFGLAVYRYNMVSNLAQEGARWASVRGMNSAIAPVDEAAVSAFVISRSVGVPVTVTTNVPPSSLTAGSMIEVRVQTVFSPLTALLSPASFTMESKAQMVVSR